MIDDKGGTTQATVSLSLSDTDGDGVADIYDTDDDDDGMPDTLGGGQRP